MKIFTLICLLSLQACSLIHIQKKLINIHPSASNYVNEFSRITNTNIKDLEIHLSKKISPLVIGLCVKETTLTNKGWYTEVVSTPKIYLNAHYWLNSVHLDKEEIVFHELGHCILNLEHSEGIMSKYTLGKTKYRLNRTALIKKLVKNTNTKNNNSVSASSLPEKYLAPKKEYEYQEFIEGMTVDIPELNWMLR